MYRFLKRVFKLQKVKYHITSLILLVSISFLLFIGQAGINVVKYPGSPFEYTRWYEFSGIEIITNYSWYEGPSGYELPLFTIVAITLMLLLNMIGLVFSTYSIVREKKCNALYEKIIGAVFILTATLYLVMFNDLYSSLLSYVTVPILMYLSGLFFAVSDIFTNIINKMRSDYKEDRLSKNHYVVSWVEKIENIEIKKQRIIFSSNKLKRVVSKLKIEQIDFSIEEKTSSLID